MTVSENIKASTAQSHQLIEKLIVDRIRSISTNSDYAHLLGLFYSYFGGLEILTEEHISTQYLPDLHERRKAVLLSEDLLGLNTQAPEKPGPDFFPWVKNRYQAFGVLYVMEGSSLGGIHIAKMILKKLPEAPITFFSGYGDRTREMWDRFRNVLDHIPGNGDEINSIISGADNTFLKMAEWIKSDMNS